MKVLKDTPLSELVLRRYEKPYGDNKREIVRKLCLSLGLLQPGDSRDIVVDIFYVLLDSREQLSSDDIMKKVIDFRESIDLPPLGATPSNIRRQLKRLRDILLIEKVGNNYQITENLSLSEIFKEKIEKFMLQSIKERVAEYFKKTDDIFPNKNKE